MRWQGQAAGWAHSFSRLLAVVRGVVWDRIDLAALLRRTAGQLDPVLAPQNAGFALAFTDDACVLIGLDPVPGAWEAGGLRIFGALAFGAGWTVNGWRLNAQIATITGEIASQREAAVTEARAEERRLQAETNDILRGLNEKLLDTNAALERDIDGLRNRPPRIVRVPGDPGPECAGTTGAELSGPDAQFLARLAARADRLRASLGACYAYADSLVR
jgi:hypothetical protein